MTDRPWDEYREPKNAPRGWQFDQCDMAWAAGYNAAVAASRAEPAPHHTGQRKRRTDRPRRPRGRPPATVKRPKPGTSEWWPQEWTNPRAVIDALRAGPRTWPEIGAKIREQHPDRSIYRTSLKHLLDSGLVEMKGEPGEPPAFMLTAKAIGLLDPVEEGDDAPSS